MEWCFSDKPSWKSTVWCKYRPNSKWSHPNQQWTHLPLPTCQSIKPDKTNPLTAEMENDDIINVIKKNKNNTPGHTNISKSILSHLPGSAITTFSNLLNISLSLGYFPKSFKHAKVKQNLTNQHPTHWTTDLYPYSKCLEKSMTKWQTTDSDHTLKTTTASHTVSTASDRTGPQTLHSL